MTQVCSLPSSTAGTGATCESKRLPKGIHIIGAENLSAPKVGGVPADESTSPVTEAIRSTTTTHPTGTTHPTDTTVAASSVTTATATTTASGVPCDSPCLSRSKDLALPWGYIFIQHMAASAFDRKLETRTLSGDFRPKCFIHRTIRHRRNASGKGVIHESVPSVSGLVFLQGTTRQLKTFLMQNFPQYYLVNNCSTGLPASIPDSVMRPFMSVMEQAPERITFLRDPFVKFAKDHVRLRVLSGLFAGQEGYVVRVDRDRQLVMNFGGYAVAIRGVHKEDFEVAE